MGGAGDGGVEPVPPGRRRASVCVNHWLMAWPIFLTLYSSSSVALKTHFSCRRSNRFRPSKLGTATSLLL